jgi:hypothetical protein
MAGMVRGFADLIWRWQKQSYDSAWIKSQPQFSSPVQAPAAGFLNGDNKKLLGGVTNNTNIKLKGDSNGAFTLGNFKWISYSAVPSYTDDLHTYK